MKVRLARADEAGLLPEIERDAGALFRTLPDYAWIADDHVRSALSWADAISTGTCWLALDSDERAIGFLGAKAIAEDLFVEELAVMSSAQGRGAGHALFAAAIAAARVDARRAVTLTTFRDVPWNAPAYVRMGFRIIGDDALPDYLRAIRECEDRAGLAWDTRCAMELVLA